MDVGTWRAGTVKRGENWRKSAQYDHGMLHHETIRIAFVAMKQAGLGGGVVENPVKQVQIETEFRARALGKNFTKLLEIFLLRMPPYISSDEIFARKWV
ncbi:hypothetical protein [Pseudorhizobium flavum]|uniref:hypothetical protein n=1 Tax=Pseudorhizobium flavum TaxID=1335061 RepID=UPI00248FC530|nr:hypothetical protein [Pseudorhizobium flavum]